jgi:hypothetical protein
MYRTQVYLDKEQVKEGKMIAKILGKSFSELLRHSLDEEIKKYSSSKKNMLHPLARFAGALPAEVVDQALDFIHKNKKSKPIQDFGGNI